MLHLSYNVLRFFFHINFFPSVLCKFIENFTCNHLSTSANVRECRAVITYHPSRHVAKNLLNPETTYAIKCTNWICRYYTCVFVENYSAQIGPLADHTRELFRLVPDTVRITPSGGGLCFRHYNLVEDFVCDLVLYPCTFKEDL